MLIRGAFQMRLATTTRPKIKVKHKLKAKVKTKPQKSKNIGQKQGKNQAKGPDKCHGNYCTGV